MTKDSSVGNLPDLIRKGNLLNLEIRAVYNRTFSHSICPNDVLKEHSVTSVKEWLYPEVEKYFETEAVLTNDAITPCLQVYKAYRQSYYKQDEYTGSSPYASDKIKETLLPGFKEADFVAEKLGFNKLSEMLSDMSWVVNSTAEGIWGAFPRGAKRFFDTSANKGLDMRYDREMVLLILDVFVKYLSDRANLK